MLDHQFVSELYFFSWLGHNLYIACYGVFVFETKSDDRGKLSRTSPAINSGIIQLIPAASCCVVRFYPTGLALFDL